MMPKFSNKSQAKLNTCHSDLVRLFSEIIKHEDCTILCGHRDKQAQTEAFSGRHSKVQYPNSKHNTIPSDAVDSIKYPVIWPKIPEIKDKELKKAIDKYVQDMGRFYEFAGFVKGVASQMGIKIKWGGDFKSFFDGPHFERVE